MLIVAGMPALALSGDQIEPCDDFLTGRGVGGTGGRQDRGDISRLQSLQLRSLHWT